MNLMKFNLGTFWRYLCALVAALFTSLKQIKLLPKYLRAVTVILLGLIPSMVSAQVTYHVDDDGPGGNGLFWQFAMNDLQVALAVAEAGDTIKVAQGIYKPGIVQEVSFNIPLEVIMLGGYVGWDELDPDVRDPDLFEKTILSGDIDDNDVHSPAEDPGDINGDNSFHVVTIIDDDAAEPFIFGTEVDGFMITAGNALHTGVGDNDTGGGGGAFIADESLPEVYEGPFAEGPLFRNCIFQGNRADRAGGAIAAVEVGLEVRDCQILNNESDGGTIVGDVNNATTAGGGGISGIGPMIVVNSILQKSVCGIPAQPISANWGIIIDKYHRACVSSRCKNKH